MVRKYDGVDAVPHGGGRRRATGASSDQTDGYIFLPVASAPATATVYEIEIQRATTEITIFTAGTSISLAKLAKAKIVLAPGTMYSWKNDVSSDEAAAFGTLDDYPSASTFYEGESTRSTFTTQ